MAIEQIVVLALLGESIVNLGMSIYVKGSTPWYLGIQWKLLVAIIIGEIVAFGFGADLFLALGFESTTPYLGLALTGLMISRGSNFIHDLIKFVQNLKDSGFATPVNK